MWDLIVSVPDHCLSFYFVKSHYFYQRAEIFRNIWLLRVRYHQYFIIY